MPSKRAIAIVGLIVVLLSHFYAITLYAVISLNERNALGTWLIVNSVSGIIWSWLTLLMVWLGMDRIMNNGGWTLLLMFHTGCGFLYLLVLASGGFFYTFHWSARPTGELWVFALLHQIIYYLFGFAMLIAMCVAPCVDCYAQSKDKLILRPSPEDCVPSLNPRPFPSLKLVN